MDDRRVQTAALAEQVAQNYETDQGRTPLLVGHHSRGQLEIDAVEKALTVCGHDPDLLWSFDILSNSDEGRPRFIEVKGRGTSGPIAGVLDREYDTANRLGSDAWLYVVFGCSTATPILRVTSDWSRLPWVRERVPKPKMPDDIRLKDRLSQSARKLAAEGTWQLDSAVVFDRFEVVT